MRIVIGMLLVVAAVAHATPIVGGGPAPDGKYPEIVALPFDNNMSSTTYCTGTLIAKTVVITAGHCVNQPPPPDNVLIGITSLDHPEAGELIDVAAVHEFPNSQDSSDVAVLVLAHDSTHAPRPIATGWASADLQNGAAIAFAGFGAVDSAGMTFVPSLQEGASTITDVDCTTNAANGCHAGAMPDGELGAGGMGIDTCSGDSGGPLYLTASYGTFVAGVTSRGYLHAASDCGGGGIYERLDKVATWIEQVSGATLLRGPEPTFDALVLDDHGGITTIAPNDPASDQHRYAIAMQPANGTAAVRADGAVKICPSAAGADRVVVTVTDAHDSARHLPVAIAYTAEVAAPTCSVDGWTGDDGGCCSTGGSGRTSLALAIALGAALTRRRAR